MTTTAQAKRQILEARRQEEGVGGIRVYPRDEQVRLVIRHVPSGLGFAETIGESVEWPHDGFTKKRLREGTLLTTAPQQAPEPAPTGNGNGNGSKSKDKNGV